MFLFVEPLRKAVLTSSIRSPQPFKVCGHLCNSNSGGGSHKTAAVGSGVIDKIAAAAYVQLHSEAPCALLVAAAKDIF